jgi:hypothetical protein
MILAHFRPAPAVNRPYTVEVVQRKCALEKTVMDMTLATHVIETEQFSDHNGVKTARSIRVRRLILLSLAAAMALATLAPMVVLAA